MSGDIKTRGKDGKEYFFKYEIFDIDHPDYIGKDCKHIKVFIDDSDDWFDSLLIKIDDNTMKSISMNNYGKKEYCGKGIPEAIIKLLSQNCKMNIISSSNKNTPSYEFRSDAATAVWERLVLEGVAKYLSGKDYYIYNYSENGNNF